MFLRCGECGVSREVVVSNDEADRFETALHARAKLVARAVRELEEERISSEVADFVDRPRARPHRPRGLRGLGTPRDSRGARSRRAASKSREARRHPPVTSRRTKTVSAASSAGTA